MTAHNVGQVQTTKFFAPATVNLLKQRVVDGSPGFQVGDLVEYIIQFTPVANGANSTYGANGYLTDYIPPGTEVVQASFVTLAGYDGSGDAIFTDITPPAAGLMPTGWGANPVTYAVSTANFNSGTVYDLTGTCAGAGFTGNNCRSRLSEMYADTGIFYSTDSRTVQNPALPTRVLQGVTGNGYTLGNMTRGASLMALLGESVNTVHNLWDACMGRAFGGGNSNTACTPNIQVSTQGPTPYRAGSAVAGPQTGYPLDYTGQVGPWQRINTAGSRIGDATLGPARDMEQTGTPANNGANWSATAPLALSAGGQATSLGYNLSLANPLPSGTNAVRWAVGRLTVGQINFVKITLRITSPPSGAGITNGSEVFGGDSSNLTGNAPGTGASIDNPWAYLVPSVADNNSNLYVSKTLCEYSSTATTCTPRASNTTTANSTLTYRITYLNTGNADQTNVLLRDVTPCQVTGSMTIGAITGSSGTYISLYPTLPYNTSTVAGTNCGAAGQTRNTVTFATIGTLGPGAGGSLILNLRNTAPAPSGSSTSTPTVNSAWLFSDSVPLGVYSNAVSYVGSTTTNANPSLSIAKTVSPNTTATGGVLTYTIVVKNTGVSPVTTLTIADILPSGGSAVSPTTRFNYLATTSIQSSGLTTSTALVTSTVTVPNYTSATTSMNPYVLGANAANQVVANWYFGSSTFAVNGVVTITFTASVGSAVPASASPYTNSARAILGTVTTNPLSYSIDAADVAGVTVTSPLGITKTLVGYFNPSTTTTFTPISPSGNIPANVRARYAVAYTNVSGTPVLTVTVSDLLPCQISSTSGSVTMTATAGPIPGAFATTSATTGNCPATRQSVILGTTSSLASGASGTLTYDVILTTPVSTSTVVANSATISGNGPPPATSLVQNNVSAVANLVITKTANPTSVLAGGTVGFTIQIVNNGTAPASTLTVYDWLPTGTSTVADSTQRFSLTGTSAVTGVTSTFASTASAIPPTVTPYSGGTYAANQQQITYNFSPTTSIPVGGTMTISLTTSVGSGLPPKTAPSYYYNNSAVTYNNGLSAASSATGTNVTLLANLSVSKSNAVASVGSGSTTSYTLTFVNSGPSAATNTVIKDLPSAGLNCTTVTCPSTAGGATCPSGMSATPILISSTSLTGTGTYIATFPAVSTVTLVVTCGVTATGS